VIEQSNRLASFQGGPGIDSQNDATGLQMRNNRKRAVPDGDSPFSSSSPFRRTLKKRSDTTRHKGEFELYGSSGVPLDRYRVPLLPIDSSGNGDLTWGAMDADEFGSSGPRSLERRSSSSGERFQVYAFDTSSTALGSSNEFDYCVRRNFGTGAHYVQWVNSSTLQSIITSGISVADVKVAIDLSATAGYLGSSTGNGVLRNNSTLTRTDGGDFITLGVANLSSSFTVVTDVQYETSSKQLQIKTISIKAISVGTESAWTMITGGQAGECDDS